MTEIAGRAGHRAQPPASLPPAPAGPHADESYSFACMHCGHGWEQSYVIEHHLDAEGREFVTYLADGRAVPSPLSRPLCERCDSHVVRIMRAGQVALVLSAGRPRPGPRESLPRAGTTAGREPGPGTAGGREPGARHRWQLSDLLHPFQRRAS
ncbi:hypothetical protein [Streptomyces sp. NPDC058739]|uniref:hypothetical protein n=1 Tax=Streptomyces sp. NPDC058739 TaxID=3346618 RepID=UPI0036795C7A